MSELNHGVSVLEPPAAPCRQPQASPTQAQPSGSGKKTGVLGWLAATLPTALLLLLLGGLAYWGQRTGWTLPKFADLIGQGQAAKDDWCEEHGVPESICVECDASLLPRGKDYGWCRQHRVHNCPLEHPDVAQLPATYPMTKADLDRAQRALDFKERPDNNSKCKLYHRRLQFASAKALDKMGIGVMSVSEERIVETINVSGEIVFEQPRVTPLYTPVAGRVWQVTDKGKIGATVREGEVLALVDAAEVGKAKAELLQAFAQVDLRAKTLETQKPLAGRAVSDVRLQQLEAEWKEAEIRLMAAQQTLVNLGLPVRLDALKKLTLGQLDQYLRFLGVPPEIAKTLDPDTTTANLVPVRAARSGQVIEVHVAGKAMVDPGKPLFVVADTSQLWLMLNVRSEDAKYLRQRDAKTGAAGQVVRFRPDGGTEEYTGELVWISRSVDDKTRTLQVRADLPNPNGKLLANTYGRGSIVLRDEKQAVVVPSEAVHWEGDCHVVFVRDKNFLTEGAPKVYHTRSVRPGVKNGPYTEIIAGVLPGEVVATSNSSLLRAQLLKNRLGEG